MLMLCSAFALGANDAKTGSDSSAGYILHIFGNANMDENIDEQDLACIQGIINGKEKATELADADLNGKIDQSDIDQVKSIINGTEKEITIIDSGNRTVKVKQPLERLVIYTHQCAEILQLLGVDDKVVGVRDTFAEQPNRFPKLSKVQSIGNGGEPDVEAVLKAKQDAVIAYTFYPKKEALDDKVPTDVKMLKFDCECSGLGPDAMILKGISLLFPGRL